MKLQLSLIFSGMLASGVAVAEYPMTFESLDTDSNGYINKTEAGARADLSENWERIDQNTDDQLDISEFSAFESEGRYTPPEEAEDAGIGAAPY